MMTTVQKELESLLDEVAPVFFDRDQLDRLVAIDNDPDAFDGECQDHDSCRSVLTQRLQ
jgi:hypothetical protein